MRNDKSQFGEAVVIDAFFKRIRPRHRFLVDVGAYGKEMSNTWNLIMENGWRGILIDGNPCRLEKIESDFQTTNVRVVMAAVGEEWSIAKFYRHVVDPHDSLMSTWRPQTQHHSIHVAVAPLTAILKSCEAPTDFDLLSIDIEGMDRAVLRRFFQDGQYQPILIVTERDSQCDDRSMFFDAGYEKMETGLSGPNDFYVKRGV